MADGLPTLTDKEKQALRLLVRGHDAKSAARHLGLSVHTINERLRDARRKLAVSSSREAGRLLLRHEAGDPQMLGPERIGEAGEPAAVAATVDRRRTPRGVVLTTGAVLMSLAFALVALTLYPQGASPPADAASAQQERGDIEAAARRWLALLDGGRWAESYAATGAAFQALNTSAVWATASERVRAPLGAMRSRTLLSHDDVPAPPHGYQVVRFRTDFANKAGAVETVSLEQDGGQWRVVGVYVS